MAAGEVVESHRHNFDHTTFINKGSARVERLDDSGVVVRAVVKHAYEAHNWVLIEAGVEHRIVALEDGTIYLCVYSHRRPDTGEVVEEWTGWMDATH